MALRFGFAALVLAAISPSVFAEDSQPKGRASKESAAPVKEASSTEKAAAKDEIPLWPCEKKLIELTNAERARYGLAPLTLEKGLLDRQKLDEILSVESMTRGGIVGREKGR